MEEHTKTCDNEQEMTLSHIRDFLQFWEGALGPFRFGTKIRKFVIVHNYVIFGLKK